MTETKHDIAVEVGRNGPYHVTDGVLLVRIEKVINSNIKPLCDTSHDDAGFRDG
jgi:CDGSH-type Zn-finger protein